MNEPFIVLKQSDWNLALEKLKALPHAYDTIECFKRGADAGEAWINPQIQALYAQLEETGRKAASYDEIQAELEELRQAQDKAP